MSDLTITFIGICTHIRRSAAFESTKSVVVNGQLGMRAMGLPIPPHSPLLNIPLPFIESMPAAMPGLVPQEAAGWWLMEGISIEVVDPSPGLSWSPDYEKVPSLKRAVDQEDLQLDRSVIEDGLAACRVDVVAGRFDAYQIDEKSPAVHVKLVVPTATPNPRLIVKRVWDEAPSEIRLQSGVVNGEISAPYLFILNTGTNTDGDVDFLLHYNVTTWTPDRLPHIDVTGIRKATPEEIARLPHTPAGQTLGCSNSNYP